MVTADVDEEGRVDISDPIRFLGWLFLGSAPPATAALTRTERSSTAGRAPAADRQDP